MFGYKRDAWDPRDKDFDKLDLRYVNVEANHLRYRRQRLDQGSAGSCVSFAKVRAMHVSMQIKGRGDAPLASPMLDYWIARRQEFARMPLARIPASRDDGSYPRMSMQATRKVGFVPWDTYPYEAAHVNVPPPSWVIASALSQRGMTYYRIAAKGNDCAESIRLALLAGYPVLFGMSVDKAFTEHTGSDVVTNVDPNEVVGQHMMSVLAVEEDGTVLVDNWWGPWWGFQDGMARLSRSLMGSAFVYDVYALQAVPDYDEPEAA